MPDKAKKLKASQIIFDMIKYMQGRQAAGGYTQEDILYLMKRWIQLGMTYEKGGDPKREGANYFTWAKTIILQDYKANPNAAMPVQSREDIGHPPKPSMEFYKALNNLANSVLSDDMIQRGYAFNDAEGAFLVLVTGYRIKLAADPDAEKHFRHELTKLRLAHTLQ